MRFAIAIIFTSIVTLGGCSSCLEAFKRVEVGKPLPDKLPAGLYRTGIGLGCIELRPGWSSTPRSRNYRSLHVLTDDNGVVVGKALFKVSPADQFGTVKTMTKTTTLEVQVPPEWWNEPASNWSRDIPPAPTWYIPAVRRYLRTHPEKEQWAFVSQWQDWYERYLSEPRALTPRMKLVGGDLTFVENVESSATGTVDQPKHSRRTALDYLCLAAQLLEAVPVGAEGSWAEVSDCEAPVASAPTWLASFGQDDLDPRQVIVDGFKWQGEAEELKVTCENLGDRRIRLEVVRWDRWYRPLEDVIGDAIVDILRGILTGLAQMG